MYSFTACLRHGIQCGVILETSSLAGKNPIGTGGKMSKEKLFLYSNICSDFTILKGSGILSDERLEEIKRLLGDDQYGPVILKDGREIENWQVHIPTGKVFANTGKPYQNYIRTIALESILSEDEIIALNKYANVYASDRREKRLFEKATKIKYSEYEGEGLYYGDSYYFDIDELLEDAEYSSEEGDDPPQYAWACTSHPVCDLSLGRIIDNATDDAYEDFDQMSLHGLDDLKKAIDTFNELNKNHLSYSVDFKRAILLNE